VRWEAGEHTTEQVPGRRVVAVLPAWEGGAAVGSAEVGGDVGKYLSRGTWREFMSSADVNQGISKLRLTIATILACLCLSSLALGQSDASNNPALPHGIQTFDSPERAAAALIDAADRFDLTSLFRIFGPSNKDIVLTGEYPLDRQRAVDFAAEAHANNTISRDPKNASRAFLLVGMGSWPFPVPIVKSSRGWFFDARAGRRELQYRRIGYNELAAIDVCHNYVDAQDEYAFRPREGFEANQYAQHIISTSGKRDGLAWQNPDGSWGGPIGEQVARAIEQGYGVDLLPYRGYFFKILKGQGPAAPLGKLDFVVDGLMIGGFALAAAPAEYGVTGISTFIVSHDGIVYQKDLGAGSLAEFQAMERFNPDSSWTPVQEQPTPQN